LAVLAQDKQMTATEVAERHTEKLVMLGPALERLQSELLGPIIDRIFAILDKFNLLPEIPREIEGMELRIEYISTLAQAQKAVGTNAITQFADYVGAIAGIVPDVTDKFDADESVDQYADMVGVPPKVVRSDDKVIEIRNERIRLQQQQAQLEQAQQAAQSSKLLSDTKLGQNSALDRIAEASGIPTEA
jgi:hypothetical protein